MCTASGTTTASIASCCLARLLLQLPCSAGPQQHCSASNQVPKQHNSTLFVCLLTTTHCLRACTTQHYCRSQAQGCHPVARTFDYCQQGPTAARGSTVATETGSTNSVRQSCAAVRSPGVPEKSHSLFTSALHDICYCSELQCIRHDEFTAMLHIIPIKTR